MNRKKILSLALVGAMVLSLGACSNGSSASAETSAETSDNEDTAADGSVVTSSFDEGTAAAELASLLNGGYAIGTIGSNENGTIVNFYNSDHTDFKQANCTMTDEQSEAFFNMDWYADDYFQQCFDALAACDDLTIITPELPDMTEYEAYEGQTVGDLEDAGFDLAGYDENADGKMVVNFYVYTDEGDTYTLRVTPDIADDDDTIYDDESVKTLTVKDISFWEFD